jgi:hypothetical protein
MRRAGLASVARDCAAVVGRLGAADGLVVDRDVGLRFLDGLNRMRVDGVRQVRMRRRP